MERTINLTFMILGALCFLVFGGFSVISYTEREQRSTKVAAAAAIGGATIFFLITLVSLPIKLILLVVLGAGFLSLILFSFLPIGKIDPGDDIPKIRFDERDIMFSRARLKPGSQEYETYYAMRPENRDGDELTRTKPGLMSPKSMFANQFLFASTDGSFTLTEALHDHVDMPATGEKTDLPVEEMTAYVKNLACYFGALEAGISELKPYHVYSHVGRGSGTYGEPIHVEHKYAIAFTVEMDHEMIGANPKPPGVMETAKQYVEAARIAVQLAAAISYLGYPARAHIDGNYRVIAPLVARDAGLGEIGRMGLLMTPHQGPRVRIGVVTTDLELIPDERETNASVIDFCNICKKCAETCPSRSIPFEDRKEIDGVLRWQIDADTCFRYWNIAGTDCGVCMTVCPYSHPNTFSHNALRWGIARSGFVRRAALWMDNLFYGKKPAPREAPEWTQIP